MKAIRVLLLCLLGLLTAAGVVAGYQLRKRPGGSGTVKSGVAPSGAPLLVNLTLIPSAAAQGAGNSSFIVCFLLPPISDKFVPMLCFCALFLYSDKFMMCAVCLDGTVPGYHLHPGFGSGADSWLVSLEGGGWCNNVATCRFSKNTMRGSSNYMEKQIQFFGISSNKPEENPGRINGFFSFLCVDLSLPNHLFAQSSLDGFDMSQTSTTGTELLFVIAMVHRSLVRVTMR
ncbi:hypothetical protein C4D60_Mb06t20630 [Musa balbisiana]|uniref:Pectin acetylesterase n=1 Tax=Musa balbisiana TaxID=52838 RepID=A0A4V4H419_MUSBA|nr:hypothetical protein C4D60_Mb06t20630 [Musa balbisiana]